MKDTCSLIGEIREEKQVVQKYPSRWTELWKKTICLIRPIHRLVNTPSPSQHSVRFRNIKPINGIRSVINTLGTVFQSLLDRLFSEFDAMDFVAVSIRLPGLEDPFWLPFTMRGLLTVNDLLRRLEAVLQSNTNVSLDGHATITVTRVVMDRGGSGRRLDRRTMNLEKWLL